MKVHKNEGFAHILVILVIVCIGIVGYSAFRGNSRGESTLPTTKPEADVTESVDKKNTEPEVKIDNNKTVFLDYHDYVYRFFDNHNKFLVSKSEATNYEIFRAKEIGYYAINDERYERLYKSEYEELEYALSPKKDYILIADVIQDPNSKINYKLVKKMTIINLSSKEQISVPFPNMLMFSGVLWKLDENKAYITARKPEGLDYSFKYYYEFNLNSKDFKLIATSDNFILSYGNSDKNFGHFILSFSGFDSSGKNIIGIGQAPEDPHLLTVWRIDPENRKFTKLYDYNTDEKLQWPKVVKNDLENNKITIQSEGKLYSMNLVDGKITDLNKNYEKDSTIKLESGIYEYIQNNSQGAYVSLKNMLTNDEVNYPLLKDNRWKDYRIITVLD